MFLSTGRKQAYASQAYFQANMSFVLFIQGLLKNYIRPVCPDARLHMIIQRFCILKFTKPADEHHLQALPTRWQTWLLYNMTVHNHLEYYCSQLAVKGKKLVTVFAICFSAIYRDRNKGDNSSTFPSLHPDCKYRAMVASPPGLLFG